MVNPSSAFKVLAVLLRHKVRRSFSSLGLGDQSSLTKCTSPCGWWQQQDFPCGLILLGTYLTRSHPEKRPHLCKGEEGRGGSQLLPWHWLLGMHWRFAAPAPSSGCHCCRPPGDRSGRLSRPSEALHKSAFSRMHKQRKSCSFT